MGALFHKIGVWMNRLKFITITIHKNEKNIIIQKFTFLCNSACFYHAPSNLEIHSSHPHPHQYCTSNYFRELYANEISLSESTTHCLKLFPFDKTSKSRLKTKKDSVQTHSH